MQFSSVLSKVQKRDAYQCFTIKYYRYQRAGRKDVEPMTHEGDLGIIGSVFMSVRYDGVQELK